MNKEILTQKAKRLYELHHTGAPLILPNIWEPLGALMLEELGYPAVATSSSAIALTHGLKDGEHISFTEHVERLSRIAKAINIPLTADVESGYAHGNNQFESNIRTLINSGISGINIEDSDKTTHTLVPAETQCKRIEMIKRISKEEGVPLFINARTDAYVTRNYFDEEGKLEESVKRGRAYIDAGAECVFPILMYKEEQIVSFVKSMSVPVNIMVYPGVPSLQRLKEIGVVRISLGGSFLKVAMSAMRHTAKVLLHLEGIEAVTQSEVTSDYLQSLIDQKK